MSEQKLAWATDIHLDFAIPRGTFEGFCQRVNDSGAQKLLITGDITTGRSIEEDLKLLAKHIDLPIYFVLGNHDYYYSSFERVAERVRRLTAQSDRLVWMDQTGIIELAVDHGLVGFGGWSDGRAGDYNRSYKLNDQVLIEDFNKLNSRQVLKKLNELGDRSAEYFKDILPQAFDRYDSVVALTHCPPFVEACFIEGYKGSYADLPHFSARSVGEVMADIMRERPDKMLVVLSGHTHSSARVAILPNLTCMVGEAQYGQPSLTLLNIKE